MTTLKYREQEDQNMWNFLFSVFFLVMLVLVLYMIWCVQGGFPNSVPWLDVILMAFATLRITRLLVYDKITRWFRELFVERKSVEREGQMWVELKPLGRGFRHTAHDLLQCPWCMSIWSALLVVLFYFVFSWGWILILLLAISGAGSLLQIMSNWIGWHAEERKHEMQSKKTPSNDF
jgi:hypothetical protein